MELRIWGSVNKWFYSEHIPKCRQQWYIVYKRTYSRLKDKGITEEWWETVARCVNGLQSIGAGYTKEEAEKASKPSIVILVCIKPSNIATPR